MRIPGRIYKLVTAILTLTPVGCTCGYQPGAPVIERIEPNSGPSHQATPVQIGGRGFAPAVTVSYRSAERSRVETEYEVWLGGYALQEAVWNDTRSLRAVVPSDLPVGTYPLIVRSPDGLAAELADAFTVLPAAAVDGGAGDAVARPDAGADAALTDGAGGDGADAGGLDGAGNDAALADVSSADAVAGDAATPDTALPDTALPDTALPDTALPDTAMPDTSQACILDPPWWDGSYAYRIPLSVDESASGVLPAGYSVVAIIDTQALVAGGQIAASGDDLRVLRSVGPSHQELDRRIVDMNSAQTEVWFKVQVDIDVSDASYLLYYGNPSAGPGPAYWADSMGAAATPSAVFLAADDFEEEPDGVLPDGWEGAPDYAVETASGNKVLGVSGDNGPADYLFAGDLAWTDVVVSAQLSIVRTSGQHYGLFTRADGLSDFDAMWYGLADNNSLQVFTVNLSSASAESLGGSLRRDWNLSPAAGSDWHSLEVRHLGRDFDFYFDGVQQGSYSPNPGSREQGRVGLCAGYPTSRALWDDVIVRMYTDPEPTVGIGVEEVYCP